MPLWLLEVVQELETRAAPLHDQLVATLGEKLPEYRPLLEDPEFLDDSMARFLWFVRSLGSLAADEPVDIAALARFIERRRELGLSLESLLEAVRWTSDAAWRGFVSVTTDLGLVDVTEALGLGGQLVRTLSELSIAEVSRSYLTSRAGPADPAREFIESLTSPGAPTPTSTRLCVTVGLDPQGTFLAAVVVTAGNPPVRDPGVLAGPSGESYLVISQHSCDDLDAAEQRFADRLQELNPGALIGVGLSQAGLVGAVSSIDEAGRCLRAARRLRETCLRYRTRWTATLVLDAEVEVRHVLEPLIEVLESEDELMATARSYLDNDGSLTASAEALHVHPNTVRYRLGRIGEQSGIDVRSLKGGWSLYIALTLALTEVEKRDRT